MDWVIEDYTAEALLTQFSEWLDVERIHFNRDDNVTHEVIVRMFIAQRNPAARPKVLA